MAKVRLAYFDNIKGVLIILVVIGHLLEPCARLGSVGLAGFRVLDFIYMFHMPLFIFLTGLFSKSVFKKWLFPGRGSSFLFRHLLSALYGAHGGEVSSGVERFF